jgi:RNA polymerase sigma-70 factor, ECF subfamily
MTSEEYKAVIEKYHRPVISLINRYVFDWETARDLAQDVFLKFWQKDVKEEKGRSVYILISRMAVNRAIDYLRHKKRDLTDKIQDQCYEFFNVAENNDFHLIIWKCLQQMKNKQKSIFILYELEGYSITEIAGILKTTKGNIRSNLHLARQKLQEILKKQYQITKESFYEL